MKSEISFNGQAIDKAKMHLLTVGLLLENELNSVEGRQLNLLPSFILGVQFDNRRHTVTSELDPMKALNQCYRLKSAHTHYDYRQTITVRVRINYSIKLKGIV